MGSGERPPALHTYSGFDGAVVMQARRINDKEEVIESPPWWWGVTERTEG